MKMNARRLAVAGLLVAGVTLLSGCQVWNGWLDLLRWKTGGSSGAALRPEESKNVLAPSSDKSLGDSGTPIPAIVPRVVVHRITAPVGTFSTNEKVWAELNEDALDSKTSVLMAQNGLRAGVAPVSRWPAIAKLIDGPGVTSDQIMCQTDGRSSVSVMTRQGVTDEIVVSIDRDLQQQGRTFEKCDNGFKLSMRGVRGKPELLVSLEPFVLLGTVVMGRTERELGITSRGITSEETFADLQMSATLTADHFLMVSAVNPKANPFSVGSLWLTETEKVPAVETVLIFVPASNAAAPAK